MIRRAIAYFIDWMLAATVMNMLVIAIAYGLTGKLYAGSLPLVFFVPNIQLIVLALLTLIEFLYYCVIPRYVWEGQTPGKRLLGIQVLRVDETPVSLARLAWRDLLCIVIVEGCFSPLSNYVRNALMLVLSRDVIQISVWVSWALGAFSIGMMLFTKRRRMLHDVLSRTIVADMRTEVDDGTDESPVTGEME